jgi:hypothetical protein
MITTGIIAAAGLLFLVLKLGPRKIISYDIPTDIAITALLMWSLAGTYSGMMAALIGGLIVSIVLFIMKKTMVREELRIGTNHIKLHKIKIPKPNLYWEKIDPRA